MSIGDQPDRVNGCHAVASPFYDPKDYPNPRAGGAGRLRLRPRLEPPPPAQPALAPARAVPWRAAAVPAERRIRSGGVAAVAQIRRAARGHHRRGAAFDLVLD